jgi:FMN phosphatase YigB (HAD superfamily)
MSNEEFPEVLVHDRRGNDRRKRSIPVALERRSGKERRQQQQGERRRQIDPTTCERDYSDDEIQFMKAMDQYKRENRRPFPTWSEVLEVLRALGYRKVAEPSTLPGLCTSLPPEVAAARD